MTDWQCSRCTKHLSLEIIECPHCNRYEKEGFNGYYNDEKMTLKTYKWIKDTEKQLYQTQLELNRYKEAYDIILHCLLNMSVIDKNDFELVFSSKKKAQELLRGKE